SAPFILAISTKAGGPTFGTSSQLNYAWFVHGKPPFVHLPSTDDVPGLRHTPRRLLAEPPTFAFDKPSVGTFPLWFDPTYWYAGTKASIDLRGQARALRRNGTLYLHMLRPLTGPALLIAFALLVALGVRRP